MELPSYHPEIHAAIDKRKTPFAITTTPPLFVPTRTIPIFRKKFDASISFDFPNIKPPRTYPLCLRPASPSHTKTLSGISANGHELPLILWLTNQIHLAECILMSSV